MMRKSDEAKIDTERKMMMTRTRTRIVTGRRSIVIVSNGTEIVVTNQTRPSLVIEANVRIIKKRRKRMETMMNRFGV